VPERPRRDVHLHRSRLRTFRQKQRGTSSILTAGVPRAGRQAVCCALMWRNWYDLNSILPAGGRGRQRGRRLSGAIASRRGRSRRGSRKGRRTDRGGARKRRTSRSRSRSRKRRRRRTLAIEQKKLSGQLGPVNLYRIPRYHVMHLYSCINVNVNVTSFPSPDRGIATQPDGKPKTHHPLSLLLNGS
jgi:hypothetical protein